MKQERAWLIATRVAGWVVGVLFAVLVATGIVLTFRYRPDVSNAYANVASLEHRPLFTARRVHRACADLFVPAVGILAIASIGLFLVRRDRAPIALSVLAGGLAVGAAVTGYLLPWDQLSLLAVTVGTNMEGYTPILGGHVQYVLLGSRTVSPATFTRWFWVHAVVLPVVIVGVFIALVIRARGSQRVG